MKERIYFDYEIHCGTVLLGRVTQTLEYEAKIAFPVDVVDGTLVMPIEIEGSQVVGAKDFWLMGDNRYPINVKTLVVPKSYKNLGAKSFSRWTTLEKVYLFCGANAMSEWNFAYCDNLKYVYCADAELLSCCEKLPKPINYKAYGCFDGILTDVNFHPINEEEYQRFYPMKMLTEEDVYISIAEETKVRFIKWLGRDSITGNEWYRLKSHDFPFELPISLKMVFIFDKVSVKDLISTKLSQKLRQRYGLRYSDGIPERGEMERYAWELVMMAAGWEFGG